MYTYVNTYYQTSPKQTVVLGIHIHTGRHKGSLVNIHTANHKSQ